MFVWRSLASERVFFIPTLHGYFINPLFSMNNIYVGVQYVQINIWQTLTYDFDVTWSVSVVVVIHIDINMATCGACNVRAGLPFQAQLSMPCSELFGVQIGTGFRIVLCDASYLSFFSALIWNNHASFIWIISSEILKIIPCIIFEWLSQDLRMVQHALRTSFRPTLAVSFIEFLWANTLCYSRYST